MLLLPGERTLQGFRRFHAGLDEQVTDQPWTRCFCLIVGAVVQSHTVLFGMIPTIGTHLIKGGGELLKRLGESLRLLRGRMQLYAYRSVQAVKHRRIGRCFLSWLKPRSTRAADIMEKPRQTPITTHFYAKVAPFPTAMADHALVRFARARKNHPADQGALVEMFLAEVRGKRRAAFNVLDPYVRVGELSRAWMQETLSQYGKPVPDSTFTAWQQKNIIEMERAGKIKPLSAQALLITRMIDRGERRFLPLGGVPVSDSWWCFVQRTPYQETEAWPVNKLHELPPASLCWTPTASAYWEPGWHPIGEDEGYLGCIRFAGIKHIRGYVWYDVGIDDLRRWDPDVAAIYAPFKGNTHAPIQVLCYSIFHRLATKRLAENEGELSSVSRKDLYE